MRLERIDHEIFELAGLQDGVVSRRQLRDMGVSAAMIDRRLCRHGWSSRLPGVYLLPGHRPSFEQDLRAAVLWGGRSAVASHRCSARLLGLERVRAVGPEIISTRRRRCPGPVILHVRPRLCDEDVTERRGIPASTAARTVVDLAAVCSPMVVEAALDSALRKGLSSMDQILETFERLARRGRNGTAAFRRLLAERSPETAPSDSELERAFLRLVRAGELPRPRAQHHVRLHGGGVAALDFAYPELKLGIELDGWAVHSGRAAFEQDRRRNAELAGLGWVILTYTWRQVTRHPRFVVENLGHALRARSRAASGRI